MLWTCCAKLTGRSSTIFSGLGHDDDDDDGDDDDDDDDVQLSFCRFCD